MGDMKSKVYIETSVVSYYTGRGSRDVIIAGRQQSHINNPFTKMMIRHAVETAGYQCPEIVSPDAFIGD